MQTTSSASHILQQILRDTQSCEALLKLLNEERDALRERNMDELERILVEKASHLEALENSANERSKLARDYAAHNAATHNTTSSAAGSDKESWREFIGKFNDEKINDCWVKLKDLLRLCKLENEVNGKLLTRNHQIYSRLLEIVRGQPRSPSLYTARGNSSASGSSNLVGEA